jgi:DNA relaxase NicK
VPAHHELLINRLLEHMPEGVKRCVGSGMMSYKFSDHLFSRDDECLATVYHGGHNPHPNVKASGGVAGRRHADILADILREEFPVHRVSRCDVATDRRGDRLYENAQRVMFSVWEGQRALGRRFRDDQQGGSAPEDGRTYYLGAPSSPVRARVYEKGKEQLAKTGDPFWLDYLDLVRLELQVRPQKAFKSEAAVLEREAFWGCAEWTRQVAQGVLAMSPEPVMLKAPRVSDHERSLRALTKQYGPTILRHVELLGSWESFSLDLQRRLGVAQGENEQAA